MQRYAFVYGFVFVAVAVLGLVPGLTTPHSDPEMVVDEGLRHAAGVFPINMLHNAVHLIFAAWGIGASRAPLASQRYLRATAVIYVLLAVMGLVDAAGLSRVFGLIPLYGHDVWLHVALASGAAIGGWSRRFAAAAGTPETAGTGRTVSRAG